MAIVINGSGTVTGLAVGGLPDGTVDSDTLATDSVTAAKIPASLENTFVSGRKNLIINGDFNIWQRGSSATAFTNSNTFLTDRFYSRNTGYGASTQEKSTDTPDGHSNSIKFVCTSAGGSFGAGDYVRMHQEIEGYNIVGTKFGTASAKSLTLSFWVKSSITGTNSIGIYNGAANKSFVSEYTVSSANTWEKKTISISAITSGTWNIDNTAELRLSFPMGSGSNYTTSTLDTWLDDFKFSSTNYIDTFGTLNATIQFAGVQLEVSDTATDFEHRSYGEELALCQRYYITTNGQHDGSYGKKASAGDGEPYCFNSTGMFPVEMRVAPTITASSGTLDQCSAFSVTANQQQYLTRVTSGSSPFRAYEQILTFDSEL